MEDTVGDFLTRFSEGNRDATEYPVDPLQAFISSLVLSTEYDEKKSTKEICELLLDKYVDVWFYGMGFLKNLLVAASSAPGSILGRDTHLLRIARLMEQNSITPKAAVTRAFLILEKVKRPTSQLAELEALLPSVFSPKKQSQLRVQFKACWTELLRCCGPALSRDMLVKLLRIVPDTVMPHIQNPELFASFFSDCFNRDGDLEVSLLSVSGLFHLISKHNLGEPADLYSRLYCLISPECMKKSSQSNRVFQLLVKALRSQLMPSHLVPVFSKRLLRVAVLVPHPSMTLWLVVAAFNLMQSHPLVSRPLVHRETSPTDELLSEDPFDLANADIESAAETVKQSSLWEIELLAQHSDPSVARVAGMFRSNFFSKKAKRISSDDYLLITDEQLLGRERKYGSHSKVKKQKADVELDQIVGEDRVEPAAAANLLLPIGVLTPHRIGRLEQWDALFYKHLTTDSC